MVSWWFAVALAGGILGLAARHDGTFHAPSPAASRMSGKRRPNIVLITAEDMSSKVGCFGDRAAHTPHLDGLAAEGVMFTNVHVTAPVCSPSRSSLWTGFHQNTLGTQNMRTVPPKQARMLGETNGWLHDYEAVLPEGIRSFTETLRLEGYWAINAGWPVPKTDYQFGDMDATMWDVQGKSVTWRDRPKDTPFFFYWNALITHESGLFEASHYLDTNQIQWPASFGSFRKQSFAFLFDMLGIFVRRFLVDDKQPTKPSDVRVPPYYPDTPVFRSSIARQYNNIAIMDAQVGQILQMLRQDGLWNETVVIFTTDHGDGLPRGKRFCYDSGSRVPLIYKAASGFQHTVSEKTPSQVDSLISFIDLAPTILHLAGLPDAASLLPGKIFLPSIGPGEENAAVFCAADRFDSNENLKARAIRTREWKLIHNIGPAAPYLTPLAFRDRLPCMKHWKMLEEKGLLENILAVKMWRDRPEWELYNMVSDPDEVDNVFKSNAKVAQDLRALLDEHIRETGDLGIKMTELELYTQMYGMNGEQPIVSAPTIKACSGLQGFYCLTNSGTNSSSIVFRWKVHGLVSLLDRHSTWNVYDGHPIPVAEMCRLKNAAPMSIEAKATRYGWKESESVLALVSCSK